MTPWGIEPATFELVPQYRPHILPSTLISKILNFYVFKILAVVNINTGA